MAVLDANEIMFRAFEPKVQNRFLLNIDTIPAYLVKNVKAPTFSDNSIKLDHINSYYCNFVSFSFTFSVC